MRTAVPVEVLRTEKAHSSDSVQTSLSDHDDASSSKNVISEKVWSDQILQSDVGKNLAF